MGARVNFEPKADDNVMDFITSHEQYLMLESSIMGDYDKYADMLFAFAKNNRWDLKKDELFVVYDANESFEKLHLKMYCPVKIDTK